MVSYGFIELTILLWATALGGEFVGDLTKTCTFAVLDWLLASVTFRTKVYMPFSKLESYFERKPT